MLQGKSCNGFFDVSYLSMHEPPCTDVLVSAHLTDQKDLFEIASDFVKKNEGNLVKTTAWEEFKKTNPTMVIEIFSSILKL